MIVVLIVQQPYAFRVLVATHILVRVDVWHRSRFTFGPGILFVVTESCTERLFTSAEYC